MSVAEAAGGGLVGGLGGVVVFSLLPFAVVQLLADSPWGKSLQVRRLSNYGRLETASVLWFLSPATGAVLVPVPSQRGPLARAEQPGEAEATDTGGVVTQRGGAGSCSSREVQPCLPLGRKLCAGGPLASLDMDVSLCEFPITHMSERTTHMGMKGKGYP